MNPVIYTDRWVVITGMRDVDYVVGKGIVIHKTEEIVLARPVGIIFGGARGVDSISLSAARRARGSFAAPYLVCIVPDRVATQPLGAQRIIRTCADEIIECKRPLHDAGSFHARNKTMLVTAQERSSDLDQAPVCVGFLDQWNSSDPKVGGGTASTMHYARAMGLEVEHVVTPRQEGGVD